MQKTHFFQSRLMSYVIPLMAFVIIVGVAWYQYHVARLDTEELLQQRAESDLDELSSMVQDDLRERILVLSHLKREWELKPEAMTQPRWNQSCQEIIDKFPGFKAIEWVDSDTVVRWITPLEGNEEAVGLRMGDEARRREALEIAREKGGHSLSRVIDLVQGGKGFLCYLPIEADEPAYKHLDGGFVLGVFHIEQWMEHLVPLHLNERLCFHIHMDHQLIYSSETVDHVHLNHFRDVKLGENLTWRITAEPMHLNLERGQLILSLGILIGLICMLAIHFGMRSAHQYRALKVTRRAYERDKLYPILAQTMSAILWRCDPTGRFIERQEGWETYTGQSWEEYRDFGWSNAISPDDRAALVTQWQESVANKSHFYSHAKAWSKLHQDYRYFAIHVEPLLDARGEVLEWVGMYHDIHDFYDTERKLQRSETEVKSINQMLHTVIDTLPVRVFWKDTHSRYLGCNISYAQDAGLTSPDELIGKTDRQLPWADQVGKYEEEDEIIMASGQARQSMEEPFRLRDGSIRWLRTSKVPLKDEKERVIGILGIYEDVSRRKHNEIELERTRRRFQLAVRGGQIGTWEWDLTTKACLYNDVLFEMLGREPQYDPVPFEEIERMTHPDDLAISVANATRCIAGEIPVYRQEQRYQRADGSWCWLLAVGEVTQRDENGEPLMLSGVHVNIDELKTAQEVIASINERFESAIEAAGYGIFDWNVNTGQVYHFDSWYTMLGYAKASMPLTYETWRDLVHPDDFDLAQNAIIAHAEGRAEKYVATYRMRHRDGYWCWIRATGVTVEKDELGRPVRIAGVQSNIQDIKKTEINLNQAIEFLQQKQREMEQFVYAISHDLKSPMVSCMGFLKFMKEDLEAGKMDEVDFAIARVQKNLNQMSDCIDDMLELSRIGRIENDTEDVNVRELIQDILDNMVTVIIDKKVKVDMPDALPLIHADKVRLTQLFQNLIGNALKYGCDKTKASNVIRILLETKQDFVSIGVMDEGEGIAEKYQGKVFEMFQRIDKKEEGTGVGLTIVKRIMEMLGGSVTIESEVGNGACFWLHFPVDLIQKKDRFTSSF